jgi:hypothetical protein
MCIVIGRTFGIGAACCPKAQDAACCTEPCVTGETHGCGTEPCPPAGECKEIRVRVMVPPTPAQPAGKMEVPNVPMTSVGGVLAPPGVPVPLPIPGAVMPPPMIPQMACPTGSPMNSYNGFGPMPAPAPSMAPPPPPMPGQWAALPRPVPDAPYYVPAAPVQAPQVYAPPPCPAPGMPYEVVPPPSVVPMAPVAVPSPGLPPAFSALRVHAHNGHLCLELDGDSITSATCKDLKLRMPSGGVVKLAPGDSVADEAIHKALDETNGCGLMKGLCGGCPFCEKCLEALEAESKQVQVSGPYFEARADHVIRLGLDDRIGLEGHVHVKYHKGDDHGSLTGEHAVIGITDGHIEVQLKSIPPFRGGPLSAPPPNAVSIPVPMGVCH